MNVWRVLCIAVAGLVGWDRSGARVSALQPADYHPEVWPADQLELLDMEAASPPPPVTYWEPPNVTSGSVADNGTSFNYSSVAAKIFSTESMVFDDEALDQVSTVTPARFGHPLLFTKQVYNFSVLTPCGNGVRDEGEQCDDGNAINGDGCGMNCTVEGGWACSSKTEQADRGHCWRCAADECTVFYNHAWHCLKTKMKFSDKNATDSVYQRASNGFCECHESRCFLGDVCMKPEGGWYRELNATCTCGSGYCLIPTAKGADASPFKNECMKMTEDYRRHPVTGLCECADARAAVSSTDPGLASPGIVAACKSFPSKPVRKAKIPGRLDIYAAFQCNRNPYSTSRSDRVCDSCQTGSCKLCNEGTDCSEPGTFSCMDAETQASSGFISASDGSCKCDDNECLVPSQNSSQCKPKDAAFPYGGVITSTGRCGCAESVMSCIMPTVTFENGTVSDFVCLDLGTSLNKTEYGQKFVRGSDGYCQCAATHCITERRSESLGDFDCIDTTKDQNYKRSGDGKCKCRSPCQFKTETPGIEQCSTCPTEPGTCVARCNNNQNINGTTTECTKYCVSKTVKLQAPPGQNPIEVPRKGMTSRVIECFVTKTVACQKLNSGPLPGWSCQQVIKARMLHNCPGRWSQHANRVLPDGTETHGFQSVCDSTDLECQLQMCDRDSTHAGMCIEKLASS